VASAKKPDWSTNAGCSGTELASMSFDDRRGAAPTRADRAGRPGEDHCPMRSFACDVENQLGPRFEWIDRIAAAVIAVSLTAPRWRSGHDGKKARDERTT